MKRIQIGITIALVVLGVSLFLVMGPGKEPVGQAKEPVGQAMTQEEIVEDLTARLIEQGVPIKSVKITSTSGTPFETIDIPIAIEFVLQRSSSESDRIALHKHSILREVDLTQKLGLEVGVITVVVVNTQGELISQGSVVTREDITSEFDPPHKLDNDSVAALLRQELDLCGMSLEKLDVYLDRHDLRWAAFDVEVPDIETANAALGTFMWKIRTTVEALNANQGTKVAVYQLNVSTTEGQPLLKYVNDLQLRRESWWQPDELTEDWFPHPPLEGPPPAE